MDDEQFDEEVALASEGRWAELGLDDIGPFVPSSIEELRDAGSG